jgi:hypothetical protein
MRLSFSLIKLEVTLGPGGNFSPVGTPMIRAFVGLAPFSMTRTDVIIVRVSVVGVFITKPDRDVEAGEHVELVVAECISDGRPMPEDSSR